MGPRSYPWPSIAPSLIAASLLLLPSLTAAQTVPQENPYGTDPKAQFKKAPNTRQLGPVYLTPKIFVSSAGVDTNVNNSSDAPIQDNSFNLTASLDAELPIGRRMRLLGYGALVPNYFHDQTDARSVDRLGSLRAEVDVGPLTPFGFFGAGRAKQRFSTEVDERLWRDERSKGVGLTARLSRKMALTAAGTQQTFTYDEGVTIEGSGVKASLDRRSRTGLGELSYALSKRTALIARAEVIEDDFVSDPTAPAGDKVRSYRYMAGPSFTSASKLAGQFLVGYRRFPESATGGAPAYDGLALDARLTIPFVGSPLVLTASRDVRYAVARSETDAGSVRNSLVSSAYALETSINLPAALLFRPAIRLERADYLLPYPADGVLGQRMDNTWTAAGALLRRFGDRVALGVTAEHYWRSSSLAGFDYSGTRYGLTAEILP